VNIVVDKHNLWCNKLYTQLKFIVKFNDIVFMLIYYFLSEFIVHISTCQWTKTIFLWNKK